MSNPIIVDPGFDDETYDPTDALIPLKTSWTDAWVTGITPTDNGVGLYVPIVLDNFLRADTAQGVLGTAPRGGAWTIVNDLEAQILSHLYVNTVANKKTGAAMFPNRFVDLMEVNFKWIATSGGGADTKIVLTQGTGVPRLNGLAIEIAHAGITVYDDDNGSPGEIATFTFTPAADGSPNKMQFIVTPTVLRAFNNGVECGNSPAAIGVTIANIRGTDLEWRIENGSTIARGAAIITVGAFVTG